MKKTKNERPSMLRGLTHAFALAAIMSSCAKTLPENEPDRAEEQVRAMSTVTSAEAIVVSLGQAKQEDLVKNNIAVSDVVGSLGSEGSNLFTTEIESINDDSYRILLKDLLIPAGEEGKRFKIKFKLTNNYLVATMTPVDESVGTFIANSLNNGRDDKKDKKIVRDFLPLNAAELEDGIPLFQYGVDFVIREKIKNDLDEETRNIKYTERTKGESTHFKLDPLLKNRTYAGGFGLEIDSIKEIYRKSTLTEAVFTIKDIKSDYLEEESFQNKSLIDNHEFQDTDIMKIVVDDKEEKAYFARALDRSQLTNDELQIVIAKKFNTLLSQCDEETAKKAKLAIEDCFLRSEFSKDIKYVSFTYDKDVAYNNNKEDSDILAATKVITTTNPESAKFIKLVKSDDKPEFVEASELKDKINEAWLPIEKFKNQEYTFRRVLEDAPNIFNYSFAGSKNSFHVEIVKFVFESDRVKVMRTAPILEKDGKTSVDSEVLMEFEAEYFRPSRTNKNSYVPASHNDETAFAVVDLSDDQIGNVQTALDRYIKNACTSGEERGLRRVENIVQTVDNKDDVLNYTLSKTYKRGQYDCADFGGSGWGPQNETLNFKERTTFMKYDHVQEGPDQDLSYEVQKKFNFGLFTGSKLDPKGYSQSTRDHDATVDLPMVFDIKNGKQIKYVLTGIPSDQFDHTGKKIRTLTKTELDLRNKIILSSQKVVDDINEGFKRAFKGTQYEGRGDVIVLEIEKDDSIPAGTKNYTVTYNLDGAEKTATIPVTEKTHLGDLQRNHIYWVEKATSSSIIGLGGPSYNPKNGIVESASVYLYGGNMKSSIDWMVEKAKAEKNFVKNMTPSKQLESLVAQSNQAAIQKALADHEAKKAAAQAQAQAQQDTIEVEVEGELNTVPNSKEKIEINSHRHGIAHHNFKSNLLNRIKVPNIANRMSKIKDAHRLMKNDFKASQYDEEEALSHFSQASEKDSKALHNAWKAVANKDEVALAKAIYGEDSVEAKRAEIVHSMNYDENGRKTPICNHESAQFALSNLAKNYDVLEMAKTNEGKNDILIDIWMPTLAHEIGHNLGLRHNFIGSFDKKNWLFPGEKESKRTSSSVMDYTIDDHATYDGLAPYDVYALRAAYTGMVELDDYTSTPITSKSINGKTVKVTPVESEFEKGMYYHLVKIQDVIDALMGETGNPADISKRAIMAQANLKRIKFCSDEDAGDTPQCQRHDFGASFEEIVDYEIQDYRQMYEYIYFPGQRQNFTGGAAFEWALNKFFKLRMLNEEVFYHLIYTPELFAGTDQAAHDATTNDLVNATIKSMFFFQSVVATPEVSPGVGLATQAQRNKRFVETIAPSQTVVKADDGTELEVNISKAMVVETKWNESYSVDNISSRARNRGIEYDKAAALIALTQSESYSYRYLSNSLRIPYQLLEQYLFGIDIKDSITQATVNQVLSGTVTPLVYDSETGRNVALDSAFKVEIGEVETNYAAMGGLLYGNIDTFEQTANPARAYWVSHINKQDLLTNRFTGADGNEYEVTEDFVAEKSDRRRAYVPYSEDSYVSGSLISKAAVMQAIVHDERWSEIFTQWEKMHVAASQLANSEPAPGATLETLAAAKKALDDASAVGEPQAIAQALQATYSQVNALIGDQVTQLEAYKVMRELMKRGGQYFVNAQFNTMLAELGFGGATVNDILNVMAQNVLPELISIANCEYDDQYCQIEDLVQLGAGNKAAYLQRKKENILNAISMPQLTEDGYSIVLPLVARVMEGLNANEQMKLGTVYLRQYTDNATIQQNMQQDAVFTEILNGAKATKTVESSYGDIKRNVKLLGLYLRIINPMEGK